MENYFTETSPITFHMTISFTVHYHFRNWHQCKIMLYVFVQMPSYNLAQEIFLHGEDSLKILQDKK